MTTYYIELFQFSNDADISKISTNTLKEVINDFTKELNNRCTEQKLNIHSVGGPASASALEGEQLPTEAVATVAEARDFRHCYIRTKIGCHCTDECGYDAVMHGISDEGQP
jgi:hypothetical protein